MAGKAGRLIAALPALALLLVAAGDDPVRALAGRYSHGFANALVDGETYHSENIVEIVPVDPGHAYLRFSLQFYNGHSCSLAGIARAEGGALVYHEPAAARVGDTACRLRVRRQGKLLVWDDDGGTCKAYCGARGSFQHDDLPWASKRPIRYMARLKASSEYRGAITAWHKDEGR